MARKRIKKNVTPVTCDDGQGAVLRLEYDRDERMQRVYLNDELKSSLGRAPMAEGIHTFHGHAGESGTTAPVAAYQVWMAFEKYKREIVYDIQRWIVGREGATRSNVQSNIDGFDIDHWELYPHAPEGVDDDS